MNFAELVRVRQSVREYLPNRVEKEKIERCLEAARLAPSVSAQQFCLQAVEEGLGTLLPVHGLRLSAVFLVSRLRAHA